MFMFDSKVATIRPYLLLGAAIHEQDYALLRSTGVTHILQIGSELRASFPDRFQYLRVSLDDMEQEDIVRHMPRCFEFIDSACHRTGAEGSPQTPAGAGAVASGTVLPAAGSGAPPPPAPGVVLVHCMAGMSRSATMVVAYLMYAERLPYTEAFKQVKAARPCIYPNLGFLLQVWEWEAGGCSLDPGSWTRWSKHRFTERLAEYRRAQEAAGLHPAVRVWLPLASSSSAAAASSVQTGDETSLPPAAASSASSLTPVAAAMAAGGERGACDPSSSSPARPGGKARRAGGVISVAASSASPTPEAGGGHPGPQPVNGASCPGRSLAADTLAESPAGATADGGDVFRDVESGCFSALPPQVGPPAIEQPAPARLAPEDTTEWSWTFPADAGTPEGNTPGVSSLVAAAAVEGVAAPSPLPTAAPPATCAAAASCSVPVVPMAAAATAAAVPVVLPRSGSLGLPGVGVGIGVGVGVGLEAVQC